MKKINKCPLDKKTLLGNDIKLKGKQCKKCEHYNEKRWYSYKGEVEVFCQYKVMPMVKDVLKGKRK